MHGHQINDCIVSNIFKKFELGGSEAVEGYLMSIAAKLVKIAMKINFHTHAHDNKSGAFLGE